MRFAYLSITTLVVLWTATSGVLALSGSQEMTQVVAQLGYPDYFLAMLGVAKALAVLALVLPVGRTLKEWTYAGIAFETLASTSSYALSGAIASDTAVPFGLSFLTFTSYILWRKTRSLNCNSWLRNLFFKLSYRFSDPLWEITRPQRSMIEIEASGAISGAVLDIGCGRGENALFLASKGHSVIGIDLSKSAIQSACKSAAQRQSSARFQQRNLFDVWQKGEIYDTVIDYGVLHQFSVGQTRKYVDTLVRLTRPGGTLLLQCFGDGEGRRVGKGPRHISEAELRATFNKDWAIDWIRSDIYEVNSGEPFPAYLMKAVRL